MFLQNFLNQKTMGQVSSFLMVTASCYELTYFFLNPEKEFLLKEKDKFLTAGQRPVQCQQ